MMVALGVVLVGLASIIVLKYPFTGLLVYWAWFLIRPQEFVEGLGGSIPLERILALSALASLFLHHKMREHRPFLSSVVTQRFFAFLAVNYISIAVSIWAGGTLQVANDLAKIFAVYFILINVVDDQVKLEKLVWVYVGAMAFGAAATLKNYASNPYYAQGIQRAVSMTLSWSDPNGTAANFVLTLPFLFALMAAAKWRNRLVLIGIFALFLVAIVLTGSRTGFLLTLCALVLSALMSRKRVLFIGAMLVLVIVGWGVMPQQYRERYAGVVSLQDGPKAGDDDSAYVSAHGRIVGWKVAWMIFKDYPIMGVGAGNFSVAFGSMNYSFEGHKGWSQPHNMPGQVLSELGLVGAVSFAAFVIIILSAAAAGRRMLHSLEDSPVFLVMLNRAIVITVLLLLIAGFSSHDLYRYNWYVAAAISVISARVLQQVASTQTADDDVAVAQLQRFAYAPEASDSDVEVNTPTAVAQCPVENLVRVPFSTTTERR